MAQAPVVAGVAGDLQGFRCIAPAAVDDGSGQAGGDQLEDARFGHRADLVGAPAGQRSVVSVRARRVLESACVAVVGVPGRVDLDDLLGVFKAPVEPSGIWVRYDVATDGHRLVDRHAQTDDLVRRADGNVCSKKGKKRKKESYRILHISLFIRTKMHYISFHNLLPP